MYRNKLIIGLNYQLKHVDILQTKSAELVRKIPVGQSTVCWSIGSQIIHGHLHQSADFYQGPASTTGEKYWIHCQSVSALNRPSL